VTSFQETGQVGEKLAGFNMQAQKDFLTGAKPGQMNLLSVKMRADEIRRSLDQLLQNLQFAPAMLQWFVDYYNHDYREEGRFCNSKNFLTI